MNMNLKLNLDLKSALQLLNRARLYLIGAALIGIFVHTSMVVNQALNIEPTPAPAKKRSAKVIFDQTTINFVKNLNVVPGQVAPSDLGKDDPFGR